MTTFSSWELYASKLGFQTVSKDPDNTSWYDLECFIVDGAKFSTSDPRLFNSYLIMIRELVNIISLSKILRIVKAKKVTPKEAKVLALAFDIAKENAKNKSQIEGFLSKIRPHTDKNHELLFEVRPWKPNKLYKQWGLLASGADLENIEKYINTKALYFNEHVKNRMLGVRPIYSDYRILKSVKPDTNPYSASKEIFWDYSQLHEVNKSLSKIEL